MAVNSHWSGEKLRYLLLLGLGLVIGAIIDQLWLGLACTFMLYSAWLLYQTRQLDIWLQKGARRAEAPDTDGVIGHVEQLIFRRKQNDKNRKARLKQIVGWYNRSAAALPDGTVVTDDNYEIVWANDAAQGYLGIRGARDARQRIDNLVRDPIFQQFIQTDDKEVLEIEIPSPVNRQLTLAIRRVAYAENLYLFSARDISQRVQLRETRQAFVANASHELKTPLTVVNGYLEMLADNKTLPEEVHRKILLAEKHARRMGDIVTDLLTLSRLENQQLDASKLDWLDLKSIIETLVHDLTENHSSHQIELKLRDDLWLKGSELEIKSVCTNLCQNAMQHTPAGTTIKVIWEKTTDGGAKLIVADNGPGIDPQHLSHITERFYRVDSEQSRETGGTGLGLSIVKHIVQRHHGQLDIDSSRRTGTRFSISFPAEHTLLQSPPDSAGRAQHG